jgi:hypothetical protein
MDSAVPGTVLQADRHVDSIAHGCYAEERATGIDDDKLPKQARAEQCLVERACLFAARSRPMGPAPATRPLSKNPSAHRFPNES